MTSRLPAPLRTALFHALRTAFRLTPMSVATRDRLRQRFLDRHGDLVPVGPRGRTAEHTAPRRPLVRADERAIGFVPYRKEPLPNPLPATLVAFYLPQFHTIPENDEWWGKGFTEWRNVTRALPQFEGHQQPKLPGDLGFYDLRNPDVMREQARLASEYGISAFCFYFYWFGGKTLLETPLRNWLADKSIDLQFCLCWANEKWSRTWDGRGDEILIDQQHSPEDDLAFIAHIADYLRDPRYLRVDGKPMLLVYRPGLFPDMRATAQRWRTGCRDHDIGEIHLAYVQSFDQIDPAPIDFDAAVEFPPNLSSGAPITGQQLLINTSYEGQVLDWSMMARNFQERPSPSYRLYRGVNCGWDNEARRPGRGRTFLHASPHGFSEWLRFAIKASTHEGRAPEPVFINAWNEWAEGAVLEPTATLGYAYLQATRDAAAAQKMQNNRFGCVLHAWHPEILREMLGPILTAPRPLRLIITTAPEVESRIRHVLTDMNVTADVWIHENRGRDILPFLHAAQRLADEGVDVVLKLHTKRTEHRDDGASWRHELTSALLHGDSIARVLDAFEQEPGLGMVCAAGHVLPIHEYIGANAAALAWLNDRMGLAPPGEDAVFAAGSMFWVRLGALRPLLDIPLHPSDFEAESAQTDGTLAHALERELGYVVQAAGYRITDTNRSEQNAALPNSAYRYARQTRA